MIGFKHWMAIVLMGSCLCLCLSACSTGKSAADVDVAADDTREMTAAEIVDLARADGVDARRDVPAESTGDDSRDGFSTTETTSNLDLTEQREDQNSAELDTEQEVDSVDTEVVCELPSSWGILRTLDFHNMRLAFESECPDVTGDGVGDNALAVLEPPLVRWPPSPESVDRLLTIAPNQNADFQGTIPSSPSCVPPPFIEYAPAPFLVEFPSDAAPSDSSGDAIHCLGWWPSTADPNHSEVLILEESFGAVPGTGFCRPRISLRIQYVDGVIESEVEDSLTVPLDLFYQFGPFSHCSLSLSPFLLRNLCFVGTASDGVLSGVLRKSDVQEWFHSAYQKDGTDLDGVGKCQELFPPSSCPMTIPLELLTPMLNQLEQLLDDSYDVDLDGDGVVDGLSFCIRVVFRPIPVSVVGTKKCDPPCL